MFAVRFALLSVLFTISSTSQTPYGDHCPTFSVGHLVGISYQLKDIQLAPDIRRWYITFPALVCPYPMHHVGTTMTVCEIDSSPIFKLFAKTYAYVERTGSLQYNALVRTTAYCSAIPSRELKKEKGLVSLIKGYYEEGQDVPAPIAHEDDSRWANLN